MSPDPIGYLSLDPAGILPFSKPLCMVRPCSCRSVLAYLLSFTRQRFAVFRLSVNQVTSGVGDDKTCTSQVSSTTAILGYHAIMENFVNDSNVNFSVYKNAYNNCCQMSFPLSESQIHQSRCRLELVGL